MAELKFALIGPYRSGTSFVMESLKLQKDMVVHGEIFQRESIDWHIESNFHPLVDLDRRFSDPIAFMQRVYDADLGKKGVGFKVLFGHNQEALSWLLAEKSVKKIFMYRPNLLAQFASGRLAEKTGVWNDANWKGRPEGLTIHFDPDEFVAYCGWLSGQIGMTKKILEDGQDYITIAYNPARLRADTLEVINWLGIPASEAQLSALKRLFDNRVTDRFDDPDLVVRTLEKYGHPEWAIE